MTVKNYFEQRIFEGYGQHSTYEKCRLYMLNMLETFTNDIDWFKNMSKEKRYEICETATLVGIHSQLQQLNETQILFKKERTYNKYSVSRPNSKVELIEVLTTEPKIIEISYEPK